MARYTYPGVYVEEVPSGARSITGVGTSITAFVGYTARGKSNSPTRVQSYGEFERSFGGLNSRSEVSYAVRQYFLNGGTEAFIVRTAAGAATASVTLKSKATGTNVLELKASSDGSWGNNLRVYVDYATSNPDSFFNLTVAEYPTGATAPTNQEIFRNLSMNPDSSSYAPDVINATSKLVVATSQVAAGDVGAADFGYSESGELLPNPGVSDSERYVRISINGEGPYDVALFPAGTGGTLNTLAALAAAMQTAIRGASASTAFASATVTSTATKIKITSGEADDASSVVVTAATSNSAARKLKLGIANGGRETEAAAKVRPAQTGTASGEITSISALTLAAADKTQIKIVSGSTTLLAETEFTLGSEPTTLAELAAALQSQIRNIDKTNTRLKGLTVQAIGTRLVVSSSAEMGTAIVTFVDGVGRTLALDLKLDGNGESNVGWYQLGSPSTAGSQVAGTPGNDGDPPTSASDVVGSESAKTGMFALENVDLFNILCIPLMADLGTTAANQVIADAMAYCEQRRAFLIVDPPTSVNTATGMEAWIRETARSKNAAAYFPQVQVADPLNDYRLKALPASGTIAGVYARTDATRGVWKAPAGIEATLSGVQGMVYTMTDGENGTLNPLAANCLRNFPVYGKISWGARTLAGADELVSEWKYVPVRRLALFIEESLYRGSKWVVFEPNDEPLWSQIRLSVGSFMHRLFRQGAFQGASPKQAYFVKCDHETTTQDDIDQGIVNILIGFAPLKPAEFVVLKLQQIAGQTQS